MSATAVEAAAIRRSTLRVAAQSRQAQGLPERVTDRAAVSKVVSLLVAPTVDEANASRRPARRRAS